MNELDALKAAYESQFPYHDENLLSLSDYVARVCASCKELQTKSLLSLGIGHAIVAQEILRSLGSQLESYIIVEGSGEIIRNFKKTIPAGSVVRCVNEYFETYTSEQVYDALEIGFVLEHVDDPEVVLKRFFRFLKPGGIAFLAVPNARSLHRLIGRAAGLLQNLYQLSPYDHQLGHKRYFDLESFSALVARCGLIVDKAEGILLKPVTTRQLQQLNLGPSIFQGLLEVARALPDISNAIYLQARKP